MAMVWGNFGAPPNPPHSRSWRASSWRRGPASRPRPGRAPPPPSAGSRRGAAIPSASPSRSARRLRQASSTAWHTSRNEGRPWAPWRGKYVPVKNGLPSGVRKAVRGQPPDPVMACNASMYTASTSGRSSRSTLTATNRSFTTAAVSGSSKDSWAITWHQWQAE